MKAMILAAGHGSRLRPLTDSKPKALVEVNNRPMLEWIILRLKQFGINEIIINVHHCADQIIRFLASKNNFGIRIEISYEKTLLDTGGGLKNASWFFKGEKDVLIHNVDILSDIDLDLMYAAHKFRKSDATLAVRNRKTQRYLLFDEHLLLKGWRSLIDNETRWVKDKSIKVKELSYNGIYIISTKLLLKLKNELIFSIIDEYLRLAKDHIIQGYVTDNFRWLDLGKKENIIMATQLFENSYFKSLEILRS